MSEDDQKYFEQRIAELENIVEAYASHTPDCDVLNFEPNDEEDTTEPKCTCGYKVAIAEYFEKHSAIEEEEYSYSTHNNEKVRKYEM